MFFWSFALTCCLLTDSSTSNATDKDIPGTSPVLVRCLSSYVGWGVVVVVVTFVITVVMVVVVLVGAYRRNNILVHKKLHEHLNRISSQGYYDHILASPLEQNKILNPAVVQTRTPVSTPCCPGSSRHSMRKLWTHLSQGYPNRTLQRSHLGIMNTSRQKLNSCFAAGTRQSVFAERKSKMPWRVAGGTDCKLFNAIRRSSRHLLRHYLIDKLVSTRSLRDRAYNNYFVLPLRDNRNFLSRALYKVLAFSTANAYL